MSLEELFNKLVEKCEEEIEKELVNRVQEVLSEKRSYNVDLLLSHFIDSAVTVAEDRVYRKISEIKAKNNW